MRTSLVSAPAPVRGARDSLPTSHPIRADTVAVVGMGYVGLPTALLLAESGMSVVGHDVSETRLAAVKGGDVDLPDAERGRLHSQLDGGRLTLTTEQGGLRAASTVLVCVPTPIDDHLVPDLGALRDACATVVAEAVTGQTIVLTSTTYVGCTRELLVEPLRWRGFTAGADVFVAFSPERIDPGVAGHAPETTPRVLGGATPACAARARAVLARAAPVVHQVSSPETAELTKLLENTFRAVNIAFANEFSTVAGRFAVDPMEAIDAAATKPYGFMPFYPGPGVGGHCIPCDPHYLLWQLRSLRMASPVTEAAMTAIATRPAAVVTRAQQVLAERGTPLAGARVLVLGVAYKPGVADVRESPAVEILDGLARAGAHVAYSDPYVPAVTTAAGELASRRYPQCEPWDLVLVHTLHPGADTGWLASVPLVLDTDYRLPSADNRRTL